MGMAGQGSVINITLYGVSERERRMEADGLF